MSLYTLTHARVAGPAEVWLFADLDSAYESLNLFAEKLKEGGAWFRFGGGNMSLMYKFGELEICEHDAPHTDTLDIS